MQTKEKCVIKTALTATLLFLTGASFLLTACGGASDDYASLESPAPEGSLPDVSIPDALKPGDGSADSPAQDTASRTDSPFHSVPYFRDDTGKCIQSLDGYLYGYWNGKLCRYDADTLQQYCYFSAVSDQSGQFCIYEDNLYFLERPHTSSLTNADTRLYMASLDGREQKLLTSQVPNCTGEYIDYDDWHIYYRIDIYDDIIYLVSYNGEDRVYYRLDREYNTVTQIEESDTLYGLLPDGYQAPRQYHYLPSLPYQMRHYGYLFLMDKNGKLAAYDAESGSLEKIPFPTDNIVPDSVFLTHDALYFAEEAEYRQPLTTWYRVSLDDLETAEVWGQFPPMRQHIGTEIFYDESGAYFAKEDGSAVSLYQIPWDGSCVTLLYSRYLEGGNASLEPAYNYRYLYYTDGDFFYFNDKKGSQYCVMRAPLHGGAPESQVVAVYAEDTMDASFAYETREHRFTANADSDDGPDSFSCDTSFTRLFLTEDTAGSRAINAYLEKVYADIDGELKDFEAECLPGDDFWPLPDRVGSYLDIGVYASYLDEHYVGVTIFRDCYYSGAAHPNTWSEEYVFDRRTGKRIAVTDLVENPVEEVCEIISAYIEADHPGFRQREDYRESVLEDSRFFLSEEGIGIHYNTYELASYVEGTDDYIIPFREFDLRKH